MKKTEQKRGRGRPATNSTAVLTALRPEMLADLDRWRERQGQDISRPEAIRRLIEWALKRARQ